MHVAHDHHVAAALKQHVTAVHCRGDNVAVEVQGAAVNADRPSDVQGVADYHVRGVAALADGQARNGVGQRQVAGPDQRAGEAGCVGFDGDGATRVDVGGSINVDLVGGERDVTGTAGNPTTSAPGAVHCHARAAVASDGDWSAGSIEVEAGNDCRIIAGRGGAADADAAFTTCNQGGRALISRNRTDAGGAASNRDGCRRIAAGLQSW